MSKPAIIVICAKCSDCFSSHYKDSAGKKIRNSGYGGYVPDFFPGEHYGDYDQLEIELASGKILNWKKPSDDAIKALINTEEEE